MDVCLDVVDGVGALNLERDDLAKTAVPRVDGSEKTRRQIESRFAGVAVKETGAAPVLRAFCRGGG